MEIPRNKSWLVLLGVGLIIGLIVSTLSLRASAARQPRTYTDAGTANQANPDTQTPVNLNSATEKDLEELPGIGPASAKKIIAGRPYSSVADLSKAGIPAKTIEKITPLVTVGALAAGENTGSSRKPASSAPITAIWASSAALTLTV